jgi:hypothetical protein
MAKLEVVRLDAGVARRVWVDMRISPSVVLPGRRHGGSNCDDLGWLLVGSGSGTGSAGADAAAANDGAVGFRVVTWAA